MAVMVRRSVAGSSSGPPNPRTRADPGARLGRRGSRSESRSQSRREATSASSEDPDRGRSFDEAFRREFDEHFPSLFRYLDRLSGDPDLAADVAQDAFLRLYRRGGLPEDTRSWLVVVARNLFWNARARSRRRRRLLVDDRGRRAMADANPSPAMDLETARRREIVRRALDSLPEREGEMLLLRYEGFRYREIAEMLGMKETSVGTSLARAKRAFRRLIEDRGDAP